MASKTSNEYIDGSYTFQVLVQSVVGEVEVSPYGGGPSAREAAFALIARHGDEGEYKFPLEDGTTEYVSIRRERDE